MLEAVFGNKSAEQVMLYLQNYGEGYGADMAQTFGVYPTAIQNQLKKLENGGILVNRPVGRARLYTWNPNNPLVKPLRSLLQETLDALPDEETKAFYRKRRRPRKSDKPL